jgi:hypothetical protein
MTGKEIANHLGRSKKSRYKGDPCWMVKCPAHDDRSASLSIVERNDGWVTFFCFRGCSRDEILAAMGLQVRDLALNDFKRNPEWEQQRKDHDRLELLERRNGLAIFMQEVEPSKRNYWRAVERNSSVEIRSLRDKIYPDEAKKNLRNQTAKHLISEYGTEELLACFWNGPAGTRMRARLERRR